MLTEVSSILAPFAIDEIEREQPDLVIYDIINLWARIASRVTKTPSMATYSVMILEEIDGMFDKRTILDSVRMALPKMPAFLWNRHKLLKSYGAEILSSPMFPSKGDMNLVFLSREFQMDTSFVDETFRFVGASINSDLRNDPPLDLPPDERPLIYISLGTVNNDNLEFYQHVLSTFADDDVCVVLSVGRQVNITKLGDIPDNFIVLPSVPQLQVLQSADVFVTHGGMNSVQEAIYYGMPMVVVPQQTEQMLNGRRVQALGAGLVISDVPPYGRIRIDDLRKAVNRVRSDLSFKQKVDEHRAYSISAGGYRRAVDVIETQLGIQYPQQVVSVTS